MCGYWEMQVPPDLQPSYGIVGCLRESGCTCMPVRLSCFEQRDKDSLLREFACKSCGTTVQILSDSPSFTPSSPEVRS